MELGALTSKRHGTANIGSLSDQCITRDSWEKCKSQEKSVLGVLAYIPIFSVIRIIKLLLGDATAGNRLIA